MENALRYAEIILQNQPQDEFILDLGKRDGTFDRMVIAFEDLGCTVDCSGDVGKMVVTRGS